MSRIRSRDTSLEQDVRSLLHRMGFRFRKDTGRKLPGRPDIVLPKYQTIILVHGCFWHRHAKCKYAYTPKSNVAFWTRKFNGNVERDREVRRLLRRAGWNVIIVWECEKRDADRLTGRLARLISDIDKRAH